MHAFVNDLLLPVGIYLYGRRIYEVMVFWKTTYPLPDQQHITQEFSRIWQAADKVMYS